MSVLDRILEQKRHEVAERKRRVRLGELPPEPGLPPRDFAAALREPRLSLIAEIKRKSPSRGWLAADVDIEARTTHYREGGAAALSVLTDEEFFGAQPGDLARAKAAAGLPTLRKDFIVDPCQVRESKALGADAVLLIVAALSDAMLGECLDVASQLHLAALVEVHTEGELDRTVDAGASIIGINNRDLRTFEVDLQRGLRLRERVPASCLTVAESGIRTRADVQAVREAGFDAALIGEALMESSEPGRLIREFLCEQPGPPATTTSSAYRHSP